MNDPSMVEFRRKMEESEQAASNTVATIERVIATGSKFPTFAQFCEWGFSPDSYTFGMFGVRESFCRTYTYAMPCAEAIDYIASFGSIVEVGAGTGFWSNLISLAGGDIIATDMLGQDSINEYRHTIGRFYPVHKLDAVAATKKYPTRTVFMCWPTLEGEWCEPVLNEMQIGQHLIYIGEGWGGCTGSESFHELLNSDQFEKVFEMGIPQWPGIHDYLMVFRKKAKDTLLIEYEA